MPTQKFRVIDLRSDTKSTPCDEMKKAMFNAVVGDDVSEEDPTVIELEKKSAKLFGKEAGLFVTSGTMCNLLAMMVHCNGKGYEIIMGDKAHCFKYENGGAASIAGVSMCKVKNLDDGTLCLNEVREAIRSYDIHEPITKLVMIENTHNVTGGKALPLEFLDEISKICKENSMKLHMDGARIFNAAEYSQTSVARIVRDVDSIGFCLSKGLSCPVGSVLLGTREFIDQARRFRKALGGGMRQAGILAAAGLFALENVVPKLSQDHKHAKKLAEALVSIKNSIFSIDLENLHTNILRVDIKNPTKSVNAITLSERLEKVTEQEIQDKICDSDGCGIVVKAAYKIESWMRFVFYAQITDELTDLAVKKITYVVKEFEKIK